MKKFKFILAMIIVGSLVQAEEHRNIKVDRSLQLQSEINKTQDPDKARSVLADLADLNKRDHLKLKEYTSKIESKEIKATLEKASDPLEMLKIAENIPLDQTDMTKEERDDMIKMLRDIAVSQKNGYDFLLYFYSASVPKKNVLNVLQEVAILQDNGVNISSKQYMLGYPEDYKGYIYDWIEELKEYPGKYKKMVVSNFHMKLDSRFFTVYGIKKVPVMAIARCQNIIPEPKTCRIHFLTTGVSSLETFFDKISKVDNRYIEYSKILQANQIYVPKKEEEVSHE